MGQDHYFTSAPGSEARQKLIEVTLADQKLKLHTASGTFSPDHVDTGTQVLLAHLAKSPKAGNILDIGCGWGPITIALALTNPNATVWAIDVNERSLELTKQNVENLGLNNVRVCKPEQVPAGTKFSGIWSNPPIRVGKEELHNILKTWIPTLDVGAESYLVVQKNLGADSLLRWLQDTFAKNFVCVREDTAKQFRVLKITNRV
jgi:16S rRNA G1207 methylase RsmC